MKKNYSKTAMFLISICLLFSSLGAWAQQQTVTINLKNASLEQVFAAIEKQTAYRFSYRNVVVDNTVKNITIDQKKAEVSSVLKTALAGTNLEFNIISDKSIVITDVKKSPVKEDPSKKFTLRGVVTDTKGEPIIGAMVVVKGTSQGTLVAVDGSYSLSVEPGQTLECSFMGYTPADYIAQTTSDVHNFQLSEDVIAMDAVVVTALGIKRSEKALGYSVQKVGADGLTMAKGVDVASSLTGKVAGLNIQNSTEFNEASKIKLRGETPLLIIDGIPYGNMSLNDVAADDIESIDVLKGATASALYGARGSSGAIMVTTKKGQQNEGGIDISINSNTMFFSGYLAFPEVQSSYSRGWAGKYNSDYIWGDKLDIGRTAIQYDPETYQWREMELTSRGKNNYKNFLEFSLMTNNNVSLTQKGKYGSMRASITQAYNKGQYPNQDLNKITFSVGGEMAYKGFSLEAAATYNKRVSSNDNGTGYSGSYIYDMVIWGSTDYDLRAYRDYWVKGKVHQQQNWYDNSWYDNPYFKAYEIIDRYDTDMLNAYFNATQNLTPWLKVMVRAGLDSYTKKNEYRNAMSANYAWDKKGFYGINRNSGYSLNTDAMLMADKTWGKFNMNILGGGNIYYYSDDYISGTTNGGLSIPGFYSLKASVDPASSTSTIKRKRVNSLYGKASVSWDNTYFIDVTGRNDWSSTLRENERSYFYPSVSGSVVLSQIISLPQIWDFWKVRASWTATKTDASVYANNNTYTINTNVWDGLNTALTPTTMIGGEVRPKSAEVFEVGTAVNFFKNRLYIDAAYFRKVESDFIISGGISSATGYSAVQVNFGEKRLRQGWELTVGGSPIRNKNFQWDILTNWSHDQYSYLKIDPVYSTKKDWVRPGESWDWMSIYDWDRDPDGNIIHNGGIPVKQNFQTKVGNLTPDLVWGITNTFSYKQFQLSLTIDGRVGGRSFSRTHQMLWNSGASKESDNQWRYDQVVDGKINYVGQGVKVVSGSVSRDSDGHIIEDTRVYAPNDVAVTYEAYISKYHDSASRPSAQNVLDETFVKLRNMSITYNLPVNVCKTLGMKNVAVAVTGQNLALWAKEYKYADPDKGGDSSGYENLNSPSQRYIGFNLRLNF